MRNLTPPHSPFARSRLGRAAGTARAMVEPLERRALLSAGDLDTTFGLGGAVVTPVSASDDVILAVDTLPDGKVLAAGRGNGERFVVARYAAEGFLDRTFGAGGADGDGVVTVDLGPNGGQATAIAQLAGGKFLVAGSIDGAHGMALVRFNADGSLDRTFAGGGADGDGVATLPFGPGGFGGVGGTAEAMAVQPDGRIVLGGSFAGAPSRWEWALARFEADGRLDRSFGPNGTGFVTASWPAPGSYLFTRINALALAPGGGILAAGSTGEDLALLKYRADGRLDPAFGRGGADGDGIVVADFGADEVGNDLAVLADGKFLVAGGSGDGFLGQGRAFVARYLPDGRTDPTFGTGDGRFSIDGREISAGADHARFSGIAAQPDGKILAAGDFDNDWPNYRDALLVRLTPEGRLDTPFAGADSYFDVPPGVVNGMIGVLSQDSAEDLALAPDGRIVLGGTTFTGGGSPLLEFAMIRYLNDIGAAGTRAYQAELAALSGPAVSVQHGGYSGSGFVDFVRASGDAAEFTVEVPASGQYELSFRYANGGSSARTTSLRVGGVAVPGGVSFAPTGSWRAWKDAPVTVPLAAGANVVRLEAAGSSGPNLDSLAVRPLQLPPAVYQAEGADVEGPIIASDVRGYTGSGFADFPGYRGASLEFAIDVPAAATYALDFRYGNGSVADRPLELRVDGAVIGNPLAFGPTGSWRTWKTEGRQVALAAGRHTVRLTAFGPGPNVDALIVTVQDTRSGAPVTLQAEAATLGGPVVRSNVPGYTGVGFADYQHARGDYVEFVYDAPAAGDYALEFRYANGGTAGRPLELSVNGSVSRPAVAFAPTGSWSSWRTVGETVALAAGRNTLRLTATGASGPNLDALTVRPVPAADVTYLAQARSVVGGLREEYEVYNPQTEEFETITEYGDDSRSAPDFGDFNGAVDVRVTPPAGSNSGLASGTQLSRLTDEGIFVAGEFDGHTSTYSGGWGLSFSGERHRTCGISGTIGTVCRDARSAAGQYTTGDEHLLKYLGRDVHSRGLFDGWGAGGLVSGLRPGGCFRPQRQPAADLAVLWGG